MRPVSIALADALASGQRLVKADLYTVVLSGGSTYRWTNSDIDVVAGGFTFARGGAGGAPLVSRGKVRQAAGLEVDKLDVMLGGGDSALLGTTKLGAAAAAGALDGAYVQVDRAFLVAGVWELAEKWFVGNVGQVVPSSREVQLEVVSELELLDRPLPRNVYQTGCGHALFDAGCGLLKSAFSTALSAGAGATLTTVPATDAHATGHFDLGWITWTSGANAGVRSAVKSWVTGGTFTLMLRLPYVPAAGDAFTAFAGCDRKQATCNTKFANLPRFRGFPYLPLPKQTETGGGGGGGGGGGDWPERLPPPRPPGGGPGPQVP